MAHSVSRHLRIAIDRYDAAIRQFIRGYDEMLDAAVDAVLAAGEQSRVVDLGSGTGALAERLLARTAGCAPRCVVELWDIDPEMLAQARERLARFGDRVLARDRSFDQPLEGADAAMASLALHHVRDFGEKSRLYRSIASGLRPGGMLVNADVTISAGDAVRRAEYRTWADHLVASGIAEEQAWAHFDEWAEEDRYFSLDEELGALAGAGFEPRCTWRLAPSTVIAATVSRARR
jgi:SAM-dependent methyltransferase